MAKYIISHKQTLSQNSLVSISSDLSALVESSVVKDFRDLTSVDLLGLSIKHWALLVGEPAFLRQMCGGSWVAVEFGGFEKSWWQLLFPQTILDDCLVSQFGMGQVSLQNMSFRLRTALCVLEFNLRQQVERVFDQKSRAQRLTAAKEF